MSRDTSYNPQPLCLPHSWPIGRTLGPIEIIYDGPSLVGSTITLSFTGGLSTQTASFVDSSTSEYPNRATITFAAWVPENPTTSSDEVTYKLNILYADGENVPLYYGTWKLKELSL